MQTFPPVCCAKLLQIDLIVVFINGPWPQPSHVSASWRMFDLVKTQNGLWILLITLFERLQCILTEL